MKAHELLSDASRWTTGVFARDVQGYRAVWWDHANAWSFCLRGALRSAYGFDPGKLVNPAYDKAEERVLVALGFPADATCALNQWNDAPKRTFDEVRSLLLRLDV